ncbi:hypothetical protein Q3G72_012982 [Acer saccharum]|nr:hypothetical protein Q3G72_012982 [Acer saccharum]
MSVPSGIVFVRRALSYLMIEQSELDLRDAMQAHVCLPYWLTTFYMQALPFNKLGMETNAKDMLNDGAFFEASILVKKKQFFRNFITIMLFGVIGSFISFGIISIGSALLLDKLNVGLKLKDYLALGAILSATDSVCTLQVGLLSAYMMKNLCFGRHSTEREVVLMVLMAYFSYIIAEDSHVSLHLGPGHNITAKSKVTAKDFSLPLCCPWKSIGVSIILLGLILVGRAASVFPLSCLSNLPKKYDKIGFKQQLGFRNLWFCLNVFTLPSPELLFSKWHSDDTSSGYNMFTGVEQTSSSGKSIVISSIIMIVLFSTALFGLLTKTFVRFTVLPQQQAIINISSEVLSPSSLTLTLIAQEQDEERNLENSGREKQMVEMTAKDTSRWWWFDSHNSSKRSPWLQSTLTELDEKAKAMLKLIEEDADSFAQRAEMYYKKRPELISMVEDFYRAHRSLAERYDQVKSETGTRLLSTFVSPFKHKPQKLMNVMDQTYYSYSGTSDTEDYAESEVDDPEQEDEIHVENESEVDQEMKEDEVSEWENEIQVGQELAEDSVSSEACDDEIMKLREEIEEVEDPEPKNEAQIGKKMKEEEDAEPEDEIQVDEELKEDSVSRQVCDNEIIKLREDIERLKEENLMQRNQLIQKDEEKREVIRQLSLALGLLKDENVNLRKYIARESPKKQSPFQFSKLKAFFFKVSG